LVVDSSLVVPVPGGGASLVAAAPTVAVSAIGATVEGTAQAARASPIANCAVTRSGLASRTRKPQSVASAALSLSLMTVGSNFTPTLP
jgi:hypothetical protein